MQKLTLRRDQWRVESLSRWWAPLSSLWRSSSEGTQGSPGVQQSWQDFDCLFLKTVDKHSCRRTTRMLLLLRFELYQGHLKSPKITDSVLMH
ncbi:hypothetical protein TGDOM2_306940 [Toxoplasma gondii GAB2-2007-GAL-DOM2]|uniref:Uncharacterized protein n=3 Tax=Toxoplasma gondii TaxID=5811 RepID=A0A086JK05_TOXGO|nr:hypothetical protein TGDOM2_306940 [Toxoplasma gondii GAB2-2007-GAL-DOM2]KFG32473.1 hypothetical protein TGFOU_306940 [Toxoplasma gondii FOU]PUA83479.1 hypothetical protein TGBR9_306940 [Toxoplasma gondii TgCATBr9]